MRTLDAVCDWFTAVLMFWGFGWGAPDEPQCGCGQAHRGCARPAKPEPGPWDGEEQPRREAELAHWIATHRE